MRDAEILEKYADYRKRIEEQTGHKMTDAEFLAGIKEARRDSLNLKADKYNTDNQDANANIPKCPTCGSVEIKMISGLSKVGSVAIWGIFSRKVHKQWHCNNCNSEWQEGKIGMVKITNQDIFLIAGDSIGKYAGELMDG